MNTQSGGFVGNFAGIAVDEAGFNVYVADIENSGRCRVALGGTVTTLAAGGFPAGVNLSATPGFQSANPAGVAIDGLGDLYVVDTNGKILVGTQPPAPAITAQPQSLTVKVGSSATLSVTASGSGLAYQWSFNGTPIPGATSAGYTIGAATVAESKGPTRWR